MGAFVKATWVSSGSGSSRRQRRSGTYHWYDPTRLSELNPQLDEDVVGDVTRAERALATRNVSTNRSTEGIARLLLRSEAVASSHIEGLTIGAQRLLRAELNELEPGSVRYDRNAVQVLGNIHALEKSLAAATQTGEVAVDDLLDIHRALCEGTDIEAYGGIVRTTQNWVGGSDFNPIGATYVPPAPELVPELLEDLVAFMNREDVSPVIQAALCHSQFETIHPFADGNGRTGRTLIQLVLVKRGTDPAAVPPISLALATNKKDYESSLYGMQHWTTPQEGHEAVNDWVSAFAAAVIESCEDSARIESELATLRTRWTERLGRRVRAGSTLAELLFEIQGMPIFTVNTMVEATGRTYAAVNNAIRELCAAGIVEEITKGKRNRVFQVPEVLEEFLLVERRLSSPQRDTTIEKPVRPVPDRKRS